MSYPAVICEVVDFTLILVQEFLTCEIEMERFNKGPTAVVTKVAVNDNLLSRSVGFSQQLESMIERAGPRLREIRF